MKLVISLLLVMCVSCARAPLKDPNEAMRLVSQVPELSDDLPMATLIQAVSMQIAQMDAEFPPKPDTPKKLRFGPRTILREEYVAGLKRFLELLHQNESSPKNLFNAVKKEFDFFEVYGRGEWGTVFMTSYYEPIIHGSLKPTARLSQALYRTPPDLVSVDLAAFDPEHFHDHHARGRLVDRKVIPYYTREEIDSKGALQGKALEICYVEPFDAFNLQIQGSGMVVLDNGERLQINYAERNGYPYQAVGKFLKVLVPGTKITMPVIEKYVHELPTRESQAFLNQNPSYVFFRAAGESAVTFVGLPAVAGRTIATDPAFFPKRALAFLATSQPIPVTRFVLDQDTGGAIKGGGRVDLFWGSGPEAGAVAGVMQQEGKLYYLLPKPPVSRLAR
jgi:membrane-bound lytic murein transglycosylase A